MTRKRKANNRLGVITVALILMSCAGGSESPRGVSQFELSESGPSWRLGPRPSSISVGNRSSVVPFANDARGWACDLIDTSTRSMSPNYVDEVNGFRSIPFRYVWPAELVLMARLAGLRLRDRWEDWSKKPSAVLRSPRAPWLHARSESLPPLTRTATAPTRPKRSRARCSRLWRRRSCPACALAPAAPGSMAPGEATLGRTSSALTEQGDLRACLRLCGADGAQIISSVRGRSCRKLSCGRSFDRLSLGGLPASSATKIALHQGWPNSPSRLARLGAIRPRSS